MTTYSEGHLRTELHAAQREVSKLHAREAREKSTAVEYTEKAIVALSGAALGFGLGVYEAQQGGTAENPYAIGGNVPVDTLAAGLGLLAILATPVRGASEKFLPVSLGAGAAAIGIWGQRAGYQWQQARAGAAPTTTPMTSTGAPLMFGGMGARPFAPGPGQYGAMHNPYVEAYG